MPSSRPRTISMAVWCFLNVPVLTTIGYWLVSLNFVFIVDVPLAGLFALQGYLAFRYFEKKPPKSLIRGIGKSILVGVLVSFLTGAVALAIINGADHVIAGNVIYADHGVRAFLIPVMLAPILGFFLGPICFTVQWYAKKWEARLKAQETRDSGLQSKSRTSTKLKPRMPRRQFKVTLQQFIAFANIYSAAVVALFAILTTAEVRRTGWLLYTNWPTLLWPSLPLWRLLSIMSVAPTSTAIVNTVSAMQFAVLFTLAWGEFRNHRWAWWTQVAVCAAAIPAQIAQILQIIEIHQNPYAKWIPAEFLQYASPVVALIVGIYVLKLASGKSLRNYLEGEPFESPRIAVPTSIPQVSPATGTAVASSSEAAEQPPDKPIVSMAAPVPGAEAPPVVERFTPLRRPPVVAVLSILQFCAAAILLYLGAQALFPDLQNFEAPERILAYISPYIRTFPTPLNFSRVVALYKTWNVRPVDFIYYNQPPLDRSWSMAAFYLCLAALSIAVGYGLWKKFKWSRFAALAISIAAVLVSALELTKSRNISSLPLWMAMANPSRGPFFSWMIFATGACLIYYFLRPSTATAFAPSRSPAVAVELPLSDKRARRAGIANGIVNLARIASILVWVPQITTFIHNWQLGVAALIGLAMQGTALIFGWKRPSRFALGLSQGYFLFALLVGGSWATLLPMFAIFGAGGNGFLGLLSVVTISILINLCGFIAATVAATSLTRAPAAHAGTWPLAFMTPLIVGILGATIVSSAFEDAGRSNAPYKRLTRQQKLEMRERSERQQQLQKLIAVYGRCIFNFNATRPDEHFPADLAALGPAGNHCLAAEDTEPAASGSYKVEYEAPGEIPRSTFKLSVSSRQDPARTYTLDQQGLLLLNGSRYGGSGSVFTLSLLSNCLEDVRYNAPDNLYPSDLRQALEYKQNSVYSCLYSSTEQALKATKDNQFNVNGETFIYQPSSDRESFVLYERPNEWGRYSFRTYRVDETHIITATAENRLPSKDDSAVELCNGSEECIGERMELIEGVPQARTHNGASQK